MVARHLGTRRDPPSLRELRTLLPFRKGPDILGMRRNRPVEAGQQRGIAGYRGGRMQKVCVSVVDIVRQFGSQHQCLAETAYPVRGWIAPQVGKPCGARRSVPRLSARAQPASANPADFLVEVLGKVKQRGS